MALPSGGETYSRRVQVNYDKNGNFISFTDPDNENRILSRDEAINRLTFNHDRGLIVDSFETSVSSGALRMPSEGVTYTFHYKEASYQEWQNPPAAFTPGPGETLQVRVIIVTPQGEVRVLYKSFGAGQRWTPELEQQMLNAAARETSSGLVEEYITSYDLEGFQIRKDYTVQRVSTRRVSE